MCLYTKQKKAKRAIFPKVRYKVLRLSPIVNTKKEYFTLYRAIGVTPSFGKILKADHFNTISEECKLPQCQNIVHLGIHTFKTKKAAEAEANNWICKISIFKVIIPIGTYYFDGEFNNLNNASCSEKIRFIKEIKKNKL